jgi:hypothetical protein
MAFASRTRPRSAGTDPVNIDEELEHFVSQIEDNIFSILAIKQKFNLLKSNGAVFERDTIEKLTSFEKHIDLIETYVTQAFVGFGSRLDRMEALSFRPSGYHPSRVITIPDTHQITSAFYTVESVYIGTDTSRVIIYSSESGQFINELGPFDSTTVVQVGSVTRGENQIFAVRTSSGAVHIVDYLKPTQKRVIDSAILSIWPSHLPSRFRMATGAEGHVNLYDDEANPVQQITVSALRLAPGPDCLLVQVSEQIIWVYEMNMLQKIGEYTIRDQIKLIAASKEYFVVSGEATFITVCSFANGGTKAVDVGSRTNFLFVWGSYYFRMGDDTLIECRDFLGKKEVIKIGDPTWWPHSSQTKLATCTIYESFLVTALDLKCVIWT